MDWSVWEALLVGLFANLVLAQALFGGIAYALLGITSTDDPKTVIVGVIADVAWIGCTLLWLQRRHAGWRERVGVFFGRRGLRDGAFGAIAGALLYPLIAVAVAVPLTVLFGALSGRDATTPDQLPGNLSTAEAAVTVILAVFIAPIAEELFFRGVLFRSIRDRRGFWLGAVASGLLFGSVHYVPAAWQDTVLLQTIMVFTGIGLAWVYERRGNLVANVATHMVFNTIGVALILTSR